MQLCWLPGQNIVHGSAGDQQVSLSPPTISQSKHLCPNKQANTSQLPSKVERADKTAPLPEHEQGGAIPGLNASGGGSQGLSQGPNAGQGKGPLKP